MHAGDVSLLLVTNPRGVHTLGFFQPCFGKGEHEKNVFVNAWCRELGIGIVAYSPLGHGFFAGRAMQEDLDSTDVRRVSCF